MYACDKKWSMDGNQVKCIHGAFSVHEYGDNQLKISHILFINLDNECVASIMNLSSYVWTVSSIGLIVESRLNLGVVST
jgi:hypothetical protein